MSKSEVKPPKVKGPVRVEAVVPFAIVVVVIGLYFTLLFDLHLRKGIEWIGGYVNGAEVNIGSLKTSFWNASFRMRDLQVTDYVDPTQNKIELGEVHFQLLWDGLLRAKFVVKDASILNIKLNNKRAHPGRILKKPEPPKEASGESPLKGLSEDALKKAEGQFKGNALGDIAGLLGGADPTSKLKDIQSQLTSVVKAEALQKELTEKQKVWEERLKALPDNKAIEDLKARIQAVEIPKDLKDPNKLKEAGEKLQALLKESDGKIKAIQGTASGLTSDLGQFQSAIQGLDELAKQDLKDIEKRIQLPQLDAKEIAKSIFGKMILDRLGQFQHYASMARQYLPAKKSGDEKEKVSSIAPPTRNVGRSYQFGRPHAYPLFWLQHAGISSQATPNSPLTGNLAGDLRDVTSDPPLIGKPMVLNIAGDFPAQKVQGLKAEVVVDHTTDQPVESLTASVASFGVEARTLTESEQIKLGFAQAQGDSKVSARLKDQQLNMQIQNGFTQVVYDVKAQNDVAEQTLKAILKGIPRVTLNASVEGSLSDLRFDIQSNLGDELKGGLERQLQARIAEARAQIQGLIDKNLKGKKDELQAQFNKVQGQVKGAVDEKKAKVDETKKVADGRTKETENAGKKGLEEAGKKGLEDLKKKFGF